MSEYIDKNGTSMTMLRYCFGLYAYYHLLSYGIKNLTRQFTVLDHPTISDCMIYDRVKPQFIILIGVLK